MSFDRSALASAIGAHGAVVRVVVAETRGSVPREVGAAMLVWTGGQAGTIGGGTLEWEAAARAREVLEGGADRLDRVALGPGVGQCCGGAVTLLSERWDAERLAGIGDHVVARPAPGRAEQPSLKVAAACGAGRGGRGPPSSAAGWSSR